jgi:GAF domain-containing protein
MTGRRSEDGHAPVLRALRNPRRLTAVMDTRRHADLAACDLHAVVDVLLTVCAVPSAAISLVTPGVQTYPAERGIGASRTVFDDDLCPFAEIVDHGHPLAVADLRQHSVYWRNPLVQEGRVVSFAGEPLTVDGAVVGAVSILDSKSREFSADQIAVLRQQAQLTGSVLERHRHGGGNASSSVARRHHDSSDRRPISSAAVRQATGRPLPEVAQDVALGNLTASEAGHVSAVGPTADTDLVLLGEHGAIAGAAAANGLFDGLG